MKKDISIDKDKKINTGEIYQHYVLVGSYKGINAPVIVLKPITTDEPRSKLSSNSWPRNRANYYCWRTP